MKHLSPKEIETLSVWLRTGVTLFQLENSENIGVVGNVRYTARCKRIFELLWAWSAPRFFGEHGEWQDRCYYRNGQRFVDARIARCNAIIERLKAKKSL